MGPRGLALAAAAHSGKHEAGQAFPWLAGPLPLGAHDHADIIFVGPGTLRAGDERRRIARAGYREIEHPKLKNLKKAGLVIFIYSLVFTSLVSFFAVMIIPDNVRGNFTENLIGGLAMHLVGSFPVRLAFHVFVVVVGTLILAGAVNTAIVGSNGVLNRVSEDGF